MPTPEQPLENFYILCKNNVDMLKWRVFFHENPSLLKASESNHSKGETKTLLGVQFLTISHLFRKVTEPYGNHSSVISSHSFAFQSILESIISQDIPHWSKSQGIRRQLSEVIDLIYENKDKQDKIFKSIKKEEESKIRLVLSCLENRKTSLIHETERIASLLQLGLKSSKETQEVGLAPSPFGIQNHIFWLYPYHTTRIEQQKLKIVGHLLNPQWNFLIPEAGFTLTRDIQDFLSELNGKSRFLKKEKIKKYPSFQRWEEENNSFFRTSSYSPEIKIWEADSFYTESALAAKAIHKLVLDERVKPHEIHVLYQEHAQAASLIDALRKNHLPVYAPSRINIKGRGVSHFISQWITLLGVSQDKIELELLFSFLKNPLCEVSYLCGRSSILPVSARMKITDPIYWQEITAEFFLPKEASLTSLIEYVQKKLEKKKQGPKNSHNSKNLKRLKKRQTENGLKYFLRALEKLSELQKKFSLLQETADAVNFFEEETKKIFRENLSDHIPMAQMREVDRCLHYLNQDCFSFSRLCDNENISIGKDVFFTMLQEYLHKMSDHVQASATEGFDSLNTEEENLTGIILRPFSEGLYSPCRYLFILDMKQQQTKKSSGSHRNIFFESEHIPEEYRQRLDECVLTEELIQMASSLTQGVCFTFVRDHSYHREIMLAFLKYHISDSDFLSGEDILNRLPSWAWETNLNSAIVKTNVNAKINTSNREKETQKSSLPSLADFLQENPEEDPGIVKGVKKGHLLEPNESISVTHFQELASCPQMFWFSKDLGLSKLSSYPYAYEPNHSDQGRFFHGMSRAFVESLIAEFPNQTYHQIALALSENTINKKLEKALDNAYQEEKFRLFSLEETSFLDFWFEYHAEATKEMFFKYFSYFFDSLKSTKESAKNSFQKAHPLADYIPLCTEFKFKNLKNAWFYFPWQYWTELTTTPLKIFY